MAFIPTPNVAKAVFRYSLYDQEVVNTLWFRGSANFTEQNLSDLCDQLAAWWTNNMADILTADILLQDITCYDMSDENGPVYTVGVNTNGGAVGSGLPGQNACVVTFRTGGRGRSARGRNYISGIREIDVTQNIVSSTLRGNLVIALNALATEVSVLNAEHVDLSYISNCVARETGLPQPIVEYFARAGIKAIRKRS